MEIVHIHKSLKELSSYIPANSGIFVIIDNNLKQYREYFDGFNITEIDACEKNKTLQTAEFIINKLLEAGADRNCFIIGAGGGITTDITGFAASIYKRGVRFGFVPTTLLAQTDASIGGKNGVNFHSYKNIIGVINRPEWIYICPDVLKTLPPREFRAGISEILKTFILFDPRHYRSAVKYFTELQEHLEQYGTYLTPADGKAEDKNIYKQEILAGIISGCSKYKCGAVERDEFEKGERRLLNLGHTFAHAIEKLCGDAAGETSGTGEIPCVTESIRYGTTENPATESNKHPELTPSPIMHGEAVSIGMVLAARLAEKLCPGECDPNFAAMIAEDLAKTGLPVEIPAGLKMKDLIKAVAKDKKVDGANIHFILPKGLGNTEDRNIPLKLLEEIVNDMR